MLHGAGKGGTGTSHDRGNCAQNDRDGRDDGVAQCQHGSTPKRECPRDRLRPVGRDSLPSPIVRSRIVLRPPRRFGVFAAYRRSLDAVDAGRYADLRILTIMRSALVVRTSATSLRGASMSRIRCDGTFRSIGSARAHAGWRSDCRFCQGASCVQAGWRPGATGRPEEERRKAEASSSGGQATLLPCDGPQDRQGDRTATQGARRRTDPGAIRAGLDPNGSTRAKITEGHQCPPSMDRTLRPSRRTR